MPRLQGKTAVITGGTTGIGFAAARLFVEEGARVAITGQDQARLDAARALLGEDVLAVRARAEDPADAERLAGALGERFGRVDVLFANAGVTWPGPIDAIEPEHVTNQFAINFTGPLLTVQKLLPLMRPGSSVVFTTSIFDRLGMPGMAVYSATKAALRSLARTLAAELKDRGIRVNTVAPGPIETPIYGKLGLAPERLRAMAADVEGRVPLGRFGTADEIAGAVLFLASDESSYMLGEEISVDGGWTQL